MKDSEREQMVQRHEATATRLQQSEAEGPRIRKKPASGVEEKKSVVRKKGGKTKGKNNREIKT